MFSSIICSGAIFNHTTICISNDFNVYSFGYCKYRSHGHNEIILYTPSKINNLTNIKMISCGSYHTICLNYNGTVFSFGYNNKGQLGIGKNEDELQYTCFPQKINLPPCKQVFCGDYFTICLSEDNKLYSFGFNFYGQLGLGNNIENYLSPQLISDINNIEYVACGESHCICKTYNNEFYSWGYNYHGQLGQGHNESCNKPIQCLNWPDSIISIKCGSRQVLLLTSEGQVYSFGSNSYGQLGINDKINKKINIPTLINDIPEIQRIECGNSHSMCIDINNNLWIFGYNYFGQLGLGDTKHRYNPIQHPTLSNIIDISSGGNHTFVKTIDNKIYAFGHNKTSQLGIETSETHKITPIQVLKGNEDIWCSTIGKSRAKSARK